MCVPGAFVGGGGCCCWVGVSGGGGGEVCSMFKEAAVGLLSVCSMVLMVSVLGGCWLSVVVVVKCVECVRRLLAVSVKCCGDGVCGRGCLMAVSSSVEVRVSV